MPNFNENPAKERPSRGQPRLQDPEDCRGHRRVAEEHTDPRMAEQVTDGQHKSLRRWILRGIRGNPIDVERFKADPHGMSRIGQPPVRERVSHQQITEFVVNAANRNRKPRQERQPDGDYKKKQKPDRERFSFR